jgi:hypothetical protein
MFSELLRISPHRPTIIEQDGGRIYITVHDEYYKRTFREWRQKLKLTHPDMNRGTKTTPPYHVPEMKIASFTLVLDGKTYERPESIRKGFVVPQRVYKVSSSGASFRKIKRQFEAWKKKERAFYSKFNLEPPDWKS